MAFQTAFYQNYAPGIEGDFASANPRASSLAGPGELVAGAGGVIVGRFAWRDAAGKVLNSGTGVPYGFVHREQGVAILTDFLAAGGNIIQQGREITLLNEGDFWVKPITAWAAGQKAFASLTTGQISAGAAGATVTGSIETNFVFGYPSSGATGIAGELAKITTWGKQ